MFRICIPILAKKLYLIRVFLFFVFETWQVTLLLHQAQVFSITETDERLSLAMKYQHRVKIQWF